MNQRNQSGQPGHSPIKRHLERGIVAAILQETERGRELMVEVNGQLERAFEEPAFGVSAQVGDRVLLNTTAMRMGLGTGGQHFVIAVEEKAHEPNALDDRPGHIMKLRYTPLQLAVHAVEEPEHPMHTKMRDAESLDGTPVVICELHSMLPAVLLSLHHEISNDTEDAGVSTDKENTDAWAGRKSGNINAPYSPCKIVYVMTDGGALPIHFSQTVAMLKQHNLLHNTVTVGHAYGGDLEAVNLYSGLLAAKHVLDADCIIVGMGPGIVGTGTRYGHTGIEVGLAVNAVHALQGDPIVVPRISFADARDRHHGLSHHTLTALGQVALAKATIPLPNLSEEEVHVIWKQLTDANLHTKHHLVRMLVVRHVFLLL